MALKINASSAILIFCFLIIVIVILRVQALFRTGRLFIPCYPEQLSELDDARLSKSDWVVNVYMEEFCGKERCKVKWGNTYHR